MNSTDSQTQLPHALEHPPGLYIIATPIGNLQDITLRALDVLKHAQLIACEDTRVSHKLLNHYGITAKTLSYNDHNGAARRPTLLKALREGHIVALISDAGTPLISDPGYKLVNAVREDGHFITALPGASSVLTALCLSGLPSDQFFFAGFLPVKAGAKKTSIEALKTIPGTLILFESARRLINTLSALHDILGNRNAAVMRELTKRYEEVKTESLETLIAHYETHGEPKGEIVIAIAPPLSTFAPLTDEDIEAKLQKLLKKHSVKDAASILAKESGKPRKELYAKAQALKENP